MRQCLFILGREPELSVAEIAAAAAKHNLPLKFLRVSHGIALVGGELPVGFVDKLAGTVKLAQVWGNVVKPTQATTEEFLLKHIAGANVEFGFSWYGRTPPPWLTASGLEIKNRLKGKGHIRFVTSRQPALSSVVVAKNRLLPPDGYDIVFYPQPDTLTIGRTVWVQDFEAWGEHDYGRPQRDARVGMLPPKLAHMMLNLAGAGPGAKLLDPFCGSGTVLQQAALMGCTDITGSDSDAKGIEGTKKNFTWLKQQHSELTVEPKLLVIDIRNLPRQLTGQTFDAIVTEPYLGPPLTGKETKERLAQIQAELIAFYQTALKVLANLLAPAGRIVMVWPVLKAGQVELLLPLEKTVQQLGFKTVDVLPPGVPKEWRNSCSTLRYERPDARVGREIVVLTK